MKVTKHSVEQYVKNNGMDEVQIDGIPEGFAFKKPDIDIGGTLHKGVYVAFLPLKHWEDDPIISCESERELLELFNKRMK